ncbi:unnamed protein product, partial [Mesorhabditis spiculigera]
MDAPNGAPSSSGRTRRYRLEHSPLRTPTSPRLTVEEIDELLERSVDTGFSYVDSVIYRPSRYQDSTYQIPNLTGFGAATGVQKINRGVYQQSSFGTTKTTFAGLLDVLVRLLGSIPGFLLYGIIWLLKPVSFLINVLVWTTHYHLWLAQGRQRLRVDQEFLSRLSAWGRYVRTASVVYEESSYMDTLGYIVRTAWRHYPPARFLWNISQKIDSFFARFTYLPPPFEKFYIPVSSQYFDSFNVKKGFSTPPRAQHESRREENSESLTTTPLRRGRPSKASSVTKRVTVDTSAPASRPAKTITSYSSDHDQDGRAQSNGKSSMKSMATLNTADPFLRNTASTVLLATKNAALNFLYISIGLGWWIYDTARKGTGFLVEAVRSRFADRASNNHLDINSRSYNLRTRKTTESVREHSGKKRLAAGVCGYCWWLLPLLFLLLVLLASRNDDVREGYRRGDLSRMTGGFLNEVISIPKNTGDLLLTTSSTGYNKLSSGVKTAGSYIRAGGSNVVDGLKNLSTDFTGTIGAAGNSSYNAVHRAVAWLGRKIFAFPAAIYHFISDGTSKAYNSSTTMFSSLYDSVGGFPAAVFNGIKHGFGLVYSGLKHCFGYIHNFYNWIVNVFHGGWTGFYDLFYSFFRVFIDIVLGVKRGMIAFTHYTFDTITDAASSIWAFLHSPSTHKSEKSEISEKAETHSHKTTEQTQQSGIDAKYLDSMITKTIEAKIAAAKEKGLSKEDMAKLIQVEMGQHAEKYRSEVDKKVSVQVEKLVEERVEALLATIVSEHLSKLTVKAEDVDRSKIELLVKNAMRKFYLDNTGLADYALESAGGSVVTTRCSETYSKASRLERIYSIPLWYSNYGPRTVIQRNSPILNPGECWPLKGSVGFLTIQLARPLRITSVSYEHVAADLTPEGRILSAPKEITFFAYKEVNDVQTRVKLGDFVYDINKDPLQFFEITVDPGFPVLYLELQVDSNYGEEFTCLYRLRVHGIPILDKPQSEVTPDEL